jgi:bacterioferritin-associated ferredoxin
MPNPTWLVIDGVDNLNGISRMTGACLGCGACDASILKFLTENIADYNA